MDASVSLLMSSSSFMAWSPSPHPAAALVTPLLWPLALVRLATGLYDSSTTLRFDPALDPLALPVCFLSDLGPAGRETMCARVCLCCAPSLSVGVRARVYVA